MNKPKASTIANYLLVIAILCLVVLPFYWVTISSIKPSEELLRSIPTFFPEKLVNEHYKELFSATTFGYYIRNSIFVSLFTMVITLFLSMTGAYSLYRCNYPFKKIISLLILSVYVFPQILLSIPLFDIMNKLKLINSLWGLIIMNVTICTPFCMWLLRPFFNSIPSEIEEAAAMDGASHLQILGKIFLPLTKPAAASVGIFTFLFSWTEFLFAKIFIFDEELKTLPVGLSIFITQYKVDWGILMAAATITAIIPIILFAFMGKYFIEGLTSGSIK
jgi:multiple sugar transport system permease protein